MTIRYLALRVVSDQPNRFRLVGPAAPDDRTDPGMPAHQAVLRLRSEDDWVSVVSLTQVGTGLIPNFHDITVEPTDDTRT